MSNPVFEAVFMSANSYKASGIHFGVINKWQIHKYGIHEYESICGWSNIYAICRASNTPYLIYLGRTLCLIMNTNIHVIISSVLSILKLIIYFNFITSLYEGTVISTLFRIRNWRKWINSLKTAWLVSEDVGILTHTVWTYS